MISLGYDADGKRIRKKVYGRSKTDVKDKLKQLHDELDQGIKTSASYTVEMAVADWLDQGLDGRSVKTISTNRAFTACRPRSEAMIRCVQARTRNWLAA